jgi:hypothetical protein
MNENQKTKPLIVELEDAKNEFVQFINTLQHRGLPCYLIEMVISDVYAQLKSGANTELAMARQQMTTEEDSE